MKLVSSSSAAIGTTLLLLGVLSTEAARSNSYLCNWQDVAVGNDFNVTGLEGIWYQIANTLIARQTAEVDCACTATRFTPSNFTQGGGGGGGGGGGNQTAPIPSNFTVDNICLNSTTNAIESQTATAWFPLSNSVGAFALNFSGPDAESLYNESQRLYPGGANYLILDAGVDNTTNADYLVLGSPCYLQASIYSKSPNMSDAAYTDATNVLTDSGYPVTLQRLTKTNQNETYCQLQREYLSNITQGSNATGGSGGGGGSTGGSTRRKLLFLR